MSEKGIGEGLGSPVEAPEAAVPAEGMRPEDVAAVAHEAAT